MCHLPSRAGRRRDGTGLGSRSHAEAGHQDAGQNQGADPLTSLRDGWTGLEVAHVMSEEWSNRRHVTRIEPACIGGACHDSHGAQTITKTNGLVKTQGTRDGERRGTTRKFAPEP